MMMMRGILEEMGGAGGGGISESGTDSSQYTSSAGFREWSDRNTSICR